jgi:hypothetical protein
MKWTSLDPRNPHCKAQAHCVACRTDPHFRDSLLRAGFVDERDFACPFGVTAETAAAVVAAAIGPRPPAPWPAWVNAVAQFRKPPDKGVGDTIARYFGVAGDAFKTWFKITFGRSCGCVERQETLNFRYPYQWRN